MSRRASLAFGLLAALAVSVLPSATPHEVMASGGRAVDEAWQADAEGYAERWNIPVEQANAELDLQAEAGRLDESLQAAEQSYAGLWISHEPAFKVSVGFTSTPEELLAAHVSPALEKVARAYTAKYSLDELSKEAQRWAELASGSADVRVDVRANRVEVLGPAAANLVRANLSGEDGGPTVAITTASLARPAVNIYGGLTLTGCTSGFSVKRIGTTTKGIVTAGHCGDSQSYNGVSLPLVTQVFSGSHDEQWHTTPGFTPVNSIRWQPDGTTRLIGARVFRSSQPTGATVCKYGKTTFYDCGEIISKIFRPSYVPNGAATFIQVRRANVDLASLGDSGGPVFIRNEAWGIVSGLLGEPYSDLIYVATDYVESGTSTTILTQ